jgi:hypothetical protein
MQCCEEAPKEDGASEDSTHSDQDHQRQQSERGVSTRMNIRVPVLVDAQHAHHGNYVHETSVWKTWINRFEKIAPANTQKETNLLLKSRATVLDFIWSIQNNTTALTMKKCVSFVVPQFGLKDWPFLLQRSML